MTQNFEANSEIGMIKQDSLNETRDSVISRSSSSSIDDTVTSSDQTNEKKSNQK
jgi:hypothetical protein